MPPYVYVKIILRITSYRTLFILKRNTGNCFCLLSYVRPSGIFLEKVRQKTLFRTTCFRLFTSSLVTFFSGVDIRKAIRSQLRPRTEGGGTAYRWEARLIEARIMEVLLCVCVRVCMYVYMCVCVCVEWCFVTTALFIFLYGISWWRPFMVEICRDYKNKYCIYNDELSCWLFHF
jgi:hypothetical protein